MKSTHPTLRLTLRNQISRVFGLALCASLLATTALAQSTYYWVGRDTSPTFFGAYWSYNNNFSTSSGGSGLGASIPSLQNYLNFDGGAVGGYINTNDFASGSGGFQIYFKNGSSAYQLYGNAITFYNFGANDPNIQNEGAFTNQTINFPIVNGNANGANGILNINLNSGTAQGPLTFNGTISALDAALAVRALNVSGSNTVTFNNVISDFSSSGKIALTQLGTGTTTLNGTNTFTGNTTINAGTVTVGNAGLLGNGLYAGGITNAGTLNLGGTNFQTLSGTLSGAGAVNKNGAGTLVLSNANTGYTGAIAIAGGTLVAANAAALGTAAGAVTFTGTSGTNTLVIQTDGGDTNKNVNFGSTTVGSTIASDVLTGSTGINHTLGSLTTGNATLTIVKGSNVASGNPSITFGTVSLSAGTAGTTILNPTTASLSLGAVSIASGSNPKTLQLDGATTNNTITGAIANNLNVLTVFKNNSSTWTLSNSGNAYSGNTTVSGGTLNLTGGAGVTNGLFVNGGGTLNLAGTFGANAVTANNVIIGQAAGRGALTIPAGATVPRMNMFVGDNVAGDGAVYQSGGTVTFSQAAGIDNLRVGSSASGKGYYRLTGGSVTAARPAIGASLADTFGVFEMTNGTLTSTEQLHITAGSATSSGLLNVLGGTVNVGTDIRMFTLAAGTAGATQQAILNVGGGTGAASVTTANNAGQGVNMAQTANIVGESGVVNLLANGTLTTSRILGSQINPALHFNFNGGKLKANTTVASPLFNDSGVDAINVLSSGGTVDNSGVAVTLGRPLLAPTGTGVTSITGPTTQGSNYIGAPMVLITGGTGSGATAYAVMADDGSGKTFKVASIVVTSPGLYTVAPTTVTLVGGGAGTVASGFTINTAANVSGGMTFIGSGATTLSGTNTYTGATVVSAGELLGATPGNLANSAITVASGSTNGVTLGAADSQWSCSGLTYAAGTTYADFNFGGYTPSTTTAPLQVNGNLTLTSTPNIIVRAAGATAVGQYPLIKYTGTLSGTPPTVALSLPSRMSATISNNVANKSIDLVVTVGNAVNWAVGNGNWDINTTANWKDGNNAAVNYLDNDAVLLDDTASGASPITISLGVNVTPRSITANLTNKSYTISPTAPAGLVIGSGPLIKNGSGTLTVATTNTTYTGAIALNGGTLSMGGGSSVGTGPITMNSGVTIQLPNSGASVSMANPITIPAAASVTFSTTALGNGIGGNITSGDSASIINISGSVSFSSTTRQFDPFNGTVNVPSGATFRFSNTSGGNGGTNTSFVVNGTLQPRNANLTMVLGSLSGSGTLGGPQTASASTSAVTYNIGTNNASTTFSGRFAELNLPPGASTTNNPTTIIKIGAGTLTLSGASTNTGTTTVAAGALIGVTGGALSNSAVTVASGATNGVNVTVPGSQFTITNLTYNAGSCVALFAFGGNTPSTTVAPLNVQNNLTFSGTLNIVVTGGSAIPLGTYPLIKYANTLTGTPPANPLSLPPYVSGIITNDTANKVIALIVTNVATPPSIVWSAGTGVWDFASLNWTNLTTAALVAWADTNAALLDDTASGAGPFTVTLNTNVNPVSITFNNSVKDYTLAGTGGIAGNNGLTKTGAGTLTIANSNTFVGATTISAGTLALGSGGTSGSLANMAIVDNSALVINRSDAVAISTVITGTGSFTNAGGGTTTLSVTNTYAGNTTVKAGTLQMTDSGNLAPASTLVLSGGQFTRASQNFTPVKSNAYKFGLAVTADSTVTTTATTTRTVHFDSANITAVPGTTLLVTNAAATGTNHFKFYAGGFSYAGNLILGGNGGNNMAFLESYNTNDTLPDQVFTGVISGAGRIYKNIEGSSPGGNLIISNAANTFSGGTELRAGYIGLGADSPLGTNRVTFGFDFNPLGLYAVDAARTLANDLYADANSTSASTAAGCTNLTIKGSQNLTLAGRIFIATNVQFFTVNNSALTTIAGVISNAAANSLGIAKLGSGTLAIAGNNTYSGDTRANIGTLQLGAANVIPDGTGKGNLSVASTLDLNTFSETVNALNGAGIIDTVAGGSPLLTIGGNNASGSFSGAIQNTAGALALTKTGSGTQTLSGISTYAGNTVIGGGTFALTGIGSIGNSPSIAVSAGALFDVSGVTGGFTLGAAQTLSGFGSVKGGVTNNGVIAPGASIGTLTLSNTPVLNGTVVMEINRTNAQTADVLNVTTPLNYGGALIVTNLGNALQAGDTFTLFNATAYAGTFTNFTLPPLTGVLIWNTNGLATNGTIAVVVGISPTSLALTSSANPSGYLNALTFTATVTPTNATGDVTFYNGATPFSTNTLVAGVASSASISSLARGTNTITASYGGAPAFYGSTNTLDQVVTNHAPTTTLAGYYRGPTPTWRIALTNLMTNATDVDSDTLTVTAFSTSTNGVTLTTNGGFALYYNTNLVNDQFTYTVDDGFGGSTTGTLNLTSQAFISGQNGSVMVSGATATVSFAGIPGFNYSVQRTTNLMDWAIIQTTNAPAGGLFDYTDDFNDLGVVPGSAYYRLIYNP